MEISRVLWQSLINTLHDSNFFDIIAEKDRKFGVAQGEIKALRATNVQKEKAIEEVLSNFMEENIV